MAFLEKMRADAAGAVPLWLDDADYTGVLLAGGMPPWLDVSACVAWRRKAQNLLHSDVVMLPLGALIDAFVERRAALLGAMRAGRRRLHPLKTLLAEPALHAHMVELSQALRMSFADAPFALSCPSPRLLAADCARMAFGGDAGELSDDDIDVAAVHTAGFLRELGEVGFDAVLLVESGDTEPVDAASAMLYQPVINVAAHYRWDIGLLAPQGRFSGAEPLFVIAPQIGSTDATAGRLVAEDFWRGVPPPACAPGGFRYAIVPPTAPPETVLGRLAFLRQ